MRRSFTGILIEKHYNILFFLFFALVTAVQRESEKNSNAISRIAAKPSQPYFDKTASKNVTTLVGKTAYLNCKVKNLGNKTVCIFNMAISY